MTSSFVASNKLHSDQRLARLPPSSARHQSVEHLALVRARVVLAELVERGVERARVLAAARAHARRRARRAAVVSRLVDVALGVSEVPPQLFALLEHAPTRAPALGVPTLRALFVRPHADDVLLERVAKRL
eukprot:26106-Pelagococcus_subviridis.AAC.3